MNLDMRNAAFPLPVVDEVNEPYWAALRTGHLDYMSCGACGHRWLPASSECPQCLSAEPRWAKASGRAHLVSWVVYHKAFHPAFADRVPYNVAVVELEEGPRLVSNIVGVNDEADLSIGRPLELVVEEEHGLFIPRFRLAG